MSECTVNIDDFRGIREMKPRTAFTPPQSATTSYGFMVLDSAAFRERAAERLDGPVAVASQPVYDIGMVREAQRFSHRNISSSARGSKVIRFSNAMPRRSNECRGVATWNASCDDPLDCPPAA